MEKLTVIVKEFQSSLNGAIEVDSRVYDNNGDPVKFKRDDGTKYHMGQNQVRYHGPNKTSLTITKKDWMNYILKVGRL